MTKISTVKTLWGPNRPHNTLKVDYVKSGCLPKECLAGWLPTKPSFVMAMGNDSGLVTYIYSVIWLSVFLDNSSLITVNIILFDFNDWLFFLQSIFLLLLWLHISPSLFLLLLLPAGNITCPHVINDT